MAKRVSADKTLFFVTLVLVFVGLVMVFSASAVTANAKYHSPYGFVLRQLIFAAGGVATMFALMKLDYHRLRHPSVVFTLMGLTTLLLLSVFFLDRSHNTHRWIRLGTLSLGQPSEMAKPALIIFLAYFLELRAKSMDDWRRTLLPAILPTVIFGTLIAAQPDLGTAIACAAITATVLFVAGVQLKYFAYPLAAMPPLFYFLVWRVSWRHQRILAFMNPYADPQGRGFHIIQSLIAVGTGGVTGLGLMEGKQKLFYLPEAHTDFIFAVTAEEWGLIGSLFIVVLFALFLYRGIRAALLSKDLFGRYLATGITCMVVVQALFNISVVLGLMPTKGIPLPLLSYGGSSLFITLACVGVLLNITQQTD
jgi:cell division protein FtsW